MHTRIVTGATLLVLAVLPIPTLAKPGAKPPLRAEGVAVDATGKVTQAGKRIGQLPLPPPPLKLEVSHPTVRGHKLLHVIVGGAGDRRGELLFEPGTARRLFSGATGPQGVDGEWSLHLRVSSGAVLLYQRRDGIERCDGAPTHLFPRLYDFTKGRFRAAASTARPKGVPELVATRARPAAVPKGAPLPLFRLTAASTQAGDEQRAINLSPPAQAEDGDPATAWSETLGSDGRGELLTARAPRSPHGLRALSIIPGDAGDARRFARANRLKTVLLVLSPTRRYRVRFARDPLRDRGDPRAPYWVLLPEPVATRCATVVLEEVYRGQRQDARQGRTAIAELRFYSELDFKQGGGLKALLADLAAADPERHRAAATVLSRQGAAALGPLLGALPKAPPGLLRRLVQVVARTPRPRAAAPLCRELPRMSPATRELALATIGKLGAAGVAAVVPLLGDGSLGADVRAAVARLLGKLGGPVATEALLAAAGSGPTSLRGAVVAGLATLPPAGTLGELLAEIRPAKPKRAADLSLAAGMLGRRTADSARRLAAAHLGLVLRRLIAPRAPTEGTRRQAASAALDPPTFELAYRLIHAIGNLDAPGQLDVLRRALGQPREPVLRWQAAQQVRRVATPAATRALVAALAGDADPRTRAAAAGALARRRAPGLARALARGLDRERWGFAGRAMAEALGHHCGAVGLASLRRAVSRGHAGVEERALLSVAQCRPPGLVRELLDLTADDRRRASLRRRAVSLLPVERLTKAQRAELLSTFVTLRRTALRNPDDELVAASCATVMGRMGGSAAARALGEAASLDASATVRAAAARALGAICAPSSRVLLQQVARDGSALVGQAARRSLRRCGWR